MASPTNHSDTDEAINPVTSVDPLQGSQPAQLSLSTTPLSPPPPQQVEHIGQSEVILPESVINRNLVVQSLQDVIPLYYYDLNDFDNHALDFIVRVAAQDQLVLSEVLRIYLESRRCDPITNPTAFIISSFQEEFLRKTVAGICAPYTNKAACRGRWYVEENSCVPRAFEKAQPRAEPPVKSRFSNIKGVIERLYKTLQLDSKMLDVASLHTILLVLSQNFRSWNVNDTCSIMEDMARCDTGHSSSDKVSHRGFQLYAQLHPSVIEQLDLPEVKQLSEYRQRLWLRVCSVYQKEELKNAGPRPLDDTARLVILRRLLNVCNLQEIEMNTQCIKQLWTFKTHALRSLVEYSTLVRFGFHCADPSMCISNLQLLLTSKQQLTAIVNRPTQKMGQSSMTQLQPNLEYALEELEEG